jgi:hypothetical protein
MALNGTGVRFVDLMDTGDAFIFVIAVSPTGSYPALGEPIATILADASMGSNIKQMTGVVPTFVDIGNSNLGHVWSYDPAQGTMGTLRNWTAVGASPTEHVTGAYTGTEPNAVFRVALTFLKFKSMSP